MVGQKKCFLRYLNLNSKFSILDNFPNDGSIFQTASKNIIGKAQGKKLAGGPVCDPRHLVANLHAVFHFPPRKKKCFWNVEKAKPEKGAAKTLFLCGIVRSEAREHALKELSSRLRVLHSGTPVPPSLCAVLHRTRALVRREFAPPCRMKSCRFLHVEQLCLLHDCWATPDAFKRVRRIPV